MFIMIYRDGFQVRAAFDAKGKVKGARIPIDGTQFRIRRDAVLGDRGRRA
jgi:hypothetical protein